MKTGLAIAPDIRPNFGHVPGVNLGGSATAMARFEYETCFLCHGDNNAVQSKIARQIVQNNTRLEFQVSAVSYHPVAAPGKNSNVPSLKAGYTASTMIYCSDCHASSDSKKGGGSAANGTHGSAYSPLLVSRYDTAMGTSYTNQAYALCFRCHEETIVMSEQNPFPLHKKHVEEHRTPCSTCHDAHGISAEQGNTTNNAHLMNFDIRYTERSTNGLFEYKSLGQGRGTCSMQCHTANKTVDHRDTRYGF
jgi:cytochrome c553